MKTIVGTHIRTLVTDPIIIGGEVGKPVSEFKIVPVGTWNTQTYGELIITAGHLSEMVNNFNARVRKAVPVDVDHDGGKAAGWITGLEVRSDGLYAVVEWTVYGESLLKNKEYTMMSPELSLAYVDPEYGTRHGAVLIAGSLVNRPLFKELDFLVASDKGGKRNLTQDGIYVLLFKENMNIQELLKKNKADLTQEELDFIKNNSSELTSEQKTEYGIEDTSAKTEENKEGDNKEEENKENNEDNKGNEEENKEGENNQDANTEISGSEVKISKVELDSLRIKADEGAKALGILKAKEAAEKIGSFVANDKGGKILPKDKEAFVNFYLACSDSQKDNFVKLLEALPTQTITEVKGSDAGGDNLTKAQELSKLANELFEKKEVKSFSEGIAKVKQLRPDLAEY